MVVTDLVWTEVMSSKAASFSTTLLGELQDALRNGNVARRVETLRRVTDLFILSADNYSDDQIDIFDDVFHYLIKQIETSAKALLANRLAPIPKAPPQLMYTLAFDDLIEVAAPVLSMSERLDDEDLIENARHKSQDHLLAISKRKVLSGAVTDVLIARGNDEVVASTVDNPGAEFSERGYDRLLSRVQGQNQGQVQGQDNLVSGIGSRKSISRPQYLKLIARASASVRARLEAANPQFADDVSSAVDEVAQRMSTDETVFGEQASRAHSLVRGLHADGRLNEQQIAAFADAGRFDETTAAIAALTNMPIPNVESMMTEAGSEGLMVLAKVIGLSWPTLRAIMSMLDTLADHEAVTDFDEYQENYEMLRVTTAQQVLRFHRMRLATEQAEPAI
jgi:uncharacterized protein (DUF2336 family)